MKRVTPELSPEDKAILERFRLEMKALDENSFANLGLLQALKTLVCPECGKRGMDQLQWKCHPEMTIKESIDKAQQNIQDKTTEADEFRKKAKERAAMLR
jgi:hypothetical protein